MIVFFSVYCWNLCQSFDKKLLQSRSELWYFILICESYLHHFSVDHSKKIYNRPFKKNCSILITFFSCSSQVYLNLSFALLERISECVFFHDWFNRNCYRQPKFTSDSVCTKFQLKRENLEFCERLSVIVFGIFPHIPVTTFRQIPFYCTCNNKICCYSFLTIVFSFQIRFGFQGSSDENYCCLRENSYWASLTLTFKVLWKKGVLTFVQFWPFILSVGRIGQTSAKIDSNHLSNSSHNKQGTVLIRVQQRSTFKNAAHWMN